MKLILFLLRSSPRVTVLAIAAGAAGGFGSTYLLALVGAMLRDPGASPRSSAAAFVAVAALVCLVRFASEALLARLGQGAVLELRTRLSRRILVAPLRHVEQLGSHRLLANLTDDVLSIGNALMLVPALFVNAAIVAGCLIYLAWLSRVALLLVFAFACVGIAGYYVPMARGMRSLMLAREVQDTLFKHFRVLVEGAKELRLHRERGEAFLSQSLCAAAESFRRHNVVGMTTYVAAAAWGQFLFFVLLGLLVIILPALGESDRASLTGSTLALLYLIPSLQFVLNVMPALGRGSVALKKVEALGLSLAERPPESGPPIPSAPDRDWRRLEMIGVTHTYESEAADHHFTLGPIDLTFTRGEIVFLIGGNGSGKTTFAKLLTGLYEPESGEIRLDGRPAAAQAVGRYRQNFSAVFSDFHLFDQLLSPNSSGLDRRARRYLSKLQLERKVEIEDGRLSTTELSRGQRKRLALLAAYMEDRPFYVFDEWAADQDPQFKEVFYRQLLPELKASGKTLLVISHDDQYYDAADRIIKLNYGQLEYEKLIAHEPHDPPYLGGPTGPDEGETTPPDAEPPGEFPTPPHPATEAGGGGPRRYAFGAASFLFLLLLAFLVVHRLAPPAPVSEGAPAGEFSSGRAMRHLRIIARSPHPAGSTEHAKVRDYIAQQLRGAGLETQVQDAVGVRGLGSIVRAAEVHNVAARLRGTDNTKAVMLVGHYDSVPVGPGASDDGAAVAAMLETLRALQAGPPLRNDVIFLFTDAEEAGLLGAQAFVDQHPWARDVGLVLNFEARGNGGPSALFETGPRNGRLVSEFARAAPRPVANSLLYALYRLLPNDTDLTVFKRAGLPGLNFAYARGLVYYHTPGDNLENIDEGSLQHHGSYCLSLARHFGALDLTDLAAGDAIYFDLFGALLIRYPQTWAAPAAFVVALVFLGVVTRGLRKKRLRFAGLALGLAAPLASALGSAAVVTLAWWLVRTARPSFYRFSSGDVYQSSLFQLSFVLLSLAICASLYPLFFRRAGVSEMLAGGSLWWLVLMLGASLLLPAGSYLFTWPLLCSCAGLAFVVEEEDRGAASWRNFVALSAGGALGVVLLVQTLYLLFVLSSLQMPGALLFGLALLSGLLAPHFRYMTLPKAFLLPGACLLASLLLGGAALVGGGFDARHRQPDSVFYGLNADTRRAVWGSADVAPDEWTSQFFPPGTRASSAADFFPGNPRNVLQREAPALPLPAPSLSIIDDSTEGDVRTLRVRVNPRPGASAVLAYLAPGAEVLGATVGAKTLDDDSPPRTSPAEAAWRLIYTAPPEGGFDLTLKVRSARPLTLKLIDQSEGLPAVPGTTIKDRPAYLMPSVADSALVSKTFSL